MMVKKVGFASLMDGVELPKSDFHFEVLGDLDECSAVLALARSNSDDAEVNAALKTMQKDLSMLMGMVAGVAVEEALFSERLAWIERLIGDLKRTVVMPKGFLVPGESQNEACLDLARAVARRAERSLTRFTESTNESDKASLQYLNRVSTVLYLYEIKSRNTAAKAAK